MKKIVFPETAHTNVTPEQIIYEANDGTKYLTVKECEEHDRWMEVRNHVHALDRFEPDEGFFQQFYFYFVKNQTDEDFVLEYLRHYSKNHVYTKGDPKMGMSPRWICVRRETDDDCLYPVYEFKNASTFKLVLQETLAMLD